MSENIFTDSDIKFMERAIELSIENVSNGGGPFGAVIVKDGEIISEGTNRVTANNDPTAHAEVMAIRNACSNLGTFKLDGSVIYSSCEPCPMCLSAIYWAGISRLYYGNTKEDAKAINFDDSFIYEEIAKPYLSRKVPSIQFLREKSIVAFRIWETNTNKVEY